MNKPIQQINNQRINSSKRSEKSGLLIFHTVIRFVCVCASASARFTYICEYSIEMWLYVNHLALHIAQTHTFPFVWLFIFGLLLMHTIRWMWTNRAHARICTRTKLNYSLLALLKFCANFTPNSNGSNDLIRFDSFLLRFFICLLCFCAYTVCANGLFLYHSSLVNLQFIIHCECDWVFLLWTMYLHFFIR